MSSSWDAINQPVLLLETPPPEKPLQPCAGWRVLHVPSSLVSSSTQKKNALQLEQAIYGVPTGRMRTQEIYCMCELSHPSPTRRQIDKRHRADKAAKRASSEVESLRFRVEEAEERFGELDAERYLVKIAQNGASST